MCHSSRLWESAAPVNSQQLPCPGPAVRREEQQPGLTALPDVFSPSASAQPRCQPRPCGWHGTAAPPGPAALLGSRGPRPCGRAGGCSPMWLRENTLSLSLFFFSSLSFFLWVWGADSRIPQAKSCPSTVRGHPTATWHLYKTLHLQSLRQTMASLSAWSQPWSARLGLSSVLSWAEMWAGEGQRVGRKRSVDGQEKGHKRAEEG